MQKLKEYFGQINFLVNGKTRHKIETELLTILYKSDLVLKDMYDFELPRDGLKKKNSINFIYSKIDGDSNNDVLDEFDKYY